MCHARHNAKMHKKVKIFTFSKVQSYTVDLLIHINIPTSITLFSNLVSQRTSSSIPQLSNFPAENFKQNLLQNPPSRPPKSTCQFQNKFFSFFSWNSIHTQKRNIPTPREYQTSIRDGELPRHANREVLSRAKARPYIYRKGTPVTRGACPRSGHI